MIKSEDLHSFSIVAKHLNISKAARELGRTQSAVSRQVMKLESLVGEKLFIRTKRDLVLTEIGRQLLRDSRQVLQSLEQINLNYTQDPLHGRKSLEVGMTPSLGMDFVALLLRSIEKLHPNLEVKIHLDVSSVLVEQLAHHRLDCAFMVLPEHIPPHLITLFLYRERFHLVGRQIPEDLSSVRWVQIQKGTHSRWLIDQYLSKRVNPYQIHFEMNSFPNIVPYLHHSNDLSVIPNSMITQIGELEHVPIDLYRHCGILAYSAGLAKWLTAVVEDFRQEFLANTKAGITEDVIPDVQS